METLKQFIIKVPAMISFPMEAPTADAARDVFLMKLEKSSLYNQGDSIGDHDLGFGDVWLADANTVTVEK